MNSKFCSVPRLIKIEYDIPERYRNSFYLANAAFFDSANWFLHRAYEVVFPNLRTAYREINTEELSELQIHQKIENIVESIDQCNSLIDVRFPVRRDDGKLELIRGFRANYGQNIQDSFNIGGLRISEDITRDQMKALALISNCKNYCMGTGLAGAMGGIKINPKIYSENELKNIIAIYIGEMYKKGYCNRRDITQPDVNTSSREMKWIKEVSSQISGDHLNTVSTGKPVEHGGLEQFQYGVALGAFKALELFINNENLMKKIGLDNVGLMGKTFIIQGLGKIGKPLGLMLVQRGAICVGVKESEAYLYDKKGINLHDLYKYQEERGTIQDYIMSKTDFPNSIFSENCDILVLSAGHKVLNCYLAKDVKAKIILEAADSPVTPSSHKILTTKSRLIIPDIYACAGANVLSFFEIVRHLQQIGHDSDDFYKTCHPIYRTIIENTSKTVQKALGQFSRTRYVALSHMDVKFTESCIDVIYDTVGKDIVATLENFQLGVDVKTAAYILAVQNIFRTIFHEKRFT